MDVGAPAAAGRRLDGIFLLILCAALLLRLFLAATVPYIHDEENTSIPLSKTISLAPGHVNLPLRGENHGALPAYFVKASSMLFGTSPLAYRALHVLLGLGAIALIYLVTRQWYGAVAARWAAALMAFNEYFLSMSARATAQAPYLFFITAAVYAFTRFLAVQRAAYLYLAGACVGLAFYCKEHAVLLLPVFFVMLLRRSYRHWFRSPHAYLAGALFVALIAPDVLWNVRTDPDAARVTYSGAELGQATYSAHLQRIGGLGLSPYPFVFYARTPVMWLYQTITGSELTYATAEYRAMNPALGLTLLGAVLMTTFRPTGRDAVRTFLLIMMWGVFCFFVLIKKGDAPYRLTPVNWVWVEATLIPAAILAGARLGNLSGRWRTAVWIFAGVALWYAIDSVVLRQTA
jgi:4-amino-4-deoxy-L-arabinose transferase-like glycosyltransferase